VQQASNTLPARPAFAPVAVPFVAGFTSIVGQIVLLREIVVLFNGNELSLGSALAAWLAWTAAGSSLAGVLVRNRANVRTAIVAAECFSGLSLAPTIWALRCARAALQTVPGELLGPAPVALVSFAALSVFCAISGCLFALAAQFNWSALSRSPHLATSYAYLFETVGSALGGIAASFLFLRYLEPFQIAVIVALLNLCMAACLCLPWRWRAIAITSVVALAIFANLRIVPLAEISTQQHLWRGFHVVASRDSIYGKLTVLGAGGLGSIYDNGSILANVPDPAAAEESVHYALLEHPNPRRVLLIGGGMNGSIAQALQHPTLEHLDYVELDPALIDLYRRLFPLEAAQAFSDPRAQVHTIDGRRYLSQSSNPYDAIVIDLPDPENAQLNRFYTAEFFTLARSRLAPGGVLALEITSSEDSVGPELASYLRCIHHTLQSVFPSVAVVPGNILHLFAATQPGVLTEDSQLLIARLRGRGLHTSYVRDDFIQYRMMPDRMEQIHDLLHPLPATPINRDFHPAAYFLAAALWSAQFRFDSPHLMESAVRIRFSALLAGIAACSFALLLAGVALPRRRARGAAAWSAIATGYALMTVQILLLLAFQSIFGYVYHALAMLIGMLMTGIALGSWLGIGRARSCRDGTLTRISALNQFLLAAAAPLLLVLADLFARTPHAAGASLIATAAFPALALLCGIPGGFQFPLASAIFQRAKTTQPGSGALYALDLVGGCAGALLLSAFLIPLFGFWNTSWVSTVMCLAPAVLLLFVKPARA